MATTTKKLFDLNAISVLVLTLKHISYPWLNIIQLDLTILHNKRETCIIISEIMDRSLLRTPSAAGNQMLYQYVHRQTSCQGHRNALGCIYSVTQLKNVSSFPLYEPLHISQSEMASKKTP